VTAQREQTGTGVPMPPRRLDCIDCGDPNTRASGGIAYCPACGATWPARFTADTTVVALAAAPADRGVLVAPRRIVRTIGQYSR